MIESAVLDQFDQMIKTCRQLIEGKIDRVRDRISLPELPSLLRP